MVECGVDGCVRDERGKTGFCEMHYQRKWRHGDLGGAEPTRRPNRGCLVDGCGGRHSGYGYCSDHLWRFKKYGDPLGKPLAKPTIVERFWAKVDKSGDCWIFTGSTIDGYGRVVMGGGKIELAHRFVWKLVNGSSPVDVLDHTCHNMTNCVGGVRCPHRRCVNPDHLEDVTKKTNILRGNGPAAVNARRTHCVNGHEFTKENTYVSRKGHRACRACHRIAGRRRYAVKVNKS